jgi:hypothetical protein
MSSDVKPFSPLTIPGLNRSTSSLDSEAVTFHSARAASQVDMSPDNPTSRSRTQARMDAAAVAMSRIDSGYDSGGNPTKERRSTSTSTSSSRSRRTGGTRSPRIPASSRPIARGSSKSSTSTSGVRRSGRPALQSRYSTPRHSTTQPPASYTFFQFPSLASESPSIPGGTSLPPPQLEPQLAASQTPPPATISYFLLPETRRLEYAAIDAASRGVRGFLVRIIPDCILPAKFRRRKFHDPEAEESDCGSVRRYRLRLEGEEKGKDRRDGKFRGRGLRVKSMDLDSDDGNGEGNEGSWRRFLGWRKR